MRPGKTTRPLQSMTVGFDCPAVRPSDRPTLLIRPFSTSTSASRTRRAPSIVTSRPPRSSSALLKEALTNHRGRRRPAAATTSRRDPRILCGAVGGRGQVEIGLDLVEQLVVGVDAGENALGGAGLQQ